MALGADGVFDKSTELDLMLAFCIEHTANVKREETKEALCEAIARSVASGSIGHPPINHQPNT